MQLFRISLKQLPIHDQQSELSRAGALNFSMFMAAPVLEYARLDVLQIYWDSCFHLETPVHLCMSMRILGGEPEDC